MVKKSIKKIVIVKKNEKTSLDKKQKFIKQRVQFLRNQPANKVGCFATPRVNKKVIINNNKTSFFDTANNIIKIRNEKIQAANKLNVKNNTSNKEITDSIDFLNFSS